MDDVMIINDPVDILVIESDSDDNENDSLEQHVDTQNKEPNGDDGMELEIIVTQDVNEIEEASTPKEHSVGAADRQAVSATEKILQELVPQTAETECQHETENNKTEQAVTENERVCSVADEHGYASTDNIAALIEKSAACNNAIENLQRIDDLIEEDPLDNDVFEDVLSAELLAEIKKDWLDEEPPAQASNITTHAPREEQQPSEQPRENRNPKRIFQRQLIRQVRKCRLLYDARHKHFTKQELKKEAWQKIAATLKAEPEQCQQQWLELRYAYQRYVRKMRKFLLTRNMQRKQRPVMPYEREMLFLWRHINERSCAPLPDALKDNARVENDESVSTITPTVVEDDDVVLLENDPIEVIDLEADDTEQCRTNLRIGPPTIYQNLRIGSEIQRLIDTIKVYPELYDPSNRYFNDYKRKGIIWSSIANELNDKATKLMKSWMLLMLRYEWEMYHFTYLTFLMGPLSELQTRLSFLQPFVNNNPKSILKQSKFLYLEWYEPIEHFKNIYNLLATMKKYPDVINFTEESLTKNVSTRMYKACWHEVALLKGVQVGQCEVTWLLLRAFYWELMNMRRDGYQLQDKWYFESIISDLYKTAGAVKKQHSINADSKQLPATEQKAKMPRYSKKVLIEKRQPVAKKRFSVLKTTDNLSNHVPTTTTAPVLNAIQYPKVIPTPVVVSETPIAQFVMPKITAACSLAPAVNEPNPPSENVNAVVENAPVMPTLVQALQAAALENTSTAAIAAPVVLNTSSHATLALQAPPPLQPKPVENIQTTLTHNVLPANVVSAAATSSIAISNVQTLNTNANVPISTPTTTTITQLYPTTYIVKKTKQPLQRRTVVPIAPKPPPVAYTAVPTSTNVSNTLTPTTAPTPPRTGFISAVPLARLQQQPLPQQKPSTPTVVPTPAVLATPSVLPMPSDKSLKTPLVIQQINYTEKPKILRISPTTVPPTTATPAITLQPLPTTSISTNVVRPTVSITKTVCTTATAVLPTVHATPDMPAQRKLPTLPVEPMKPTFPKLPTLPKLNAPAGHALNPNEVIIELIAMSKGNFLVVQGPMLREKFMLSMGKTASFIREIISIPLLHNKDYQETSNYYWNAIAQKFNLPANICRACWNFLSENFQHFPQIAPMNELMRPVKITNLKVWKNSNELFKTFNEKAIANGWLQFSTQLPLLIGLISRFPSLYKDILRSGCKVPNRPMNLFESNAYEHCATQFKSIPNIPAVWTAFKEVFLQYMLDIENGIENNWPYNWWHALAKCTFLYEARYHDKQPYFYIVRYKIIEELERCTNFEAKMSKIGKDKLKVLRETRTYQPKRIRSNIHPLTLPGEKNSAVKLKFRGDLDAYELITTIRRHPEIYERSDVHQKRLAWAAVAKELRTNITTCRLSFQYALKTYRKYKRADVDGGCPITQKYFRYFEEIERAVRSQQSKLSIKTPTQLNQSVIHVGEPSDVAFPEYYIPEITMTTSKPALVMKNWAYAVGTLKRANLEHNLQAIFTKYRALAAGNTQLPLPQAVSKNK